MSESEIRLTTAASPRPVLSLWWVAFAVGCLVALLAPALVHTAYGAHVLVLTLLFVTFTTAFNLFIGYTGYLSLAHACFFGVAAYAAALLNTRAGWGFWTNLVAGGVASGILAFLIGWVALRRLRGFPFAIVTLGLTITAFIVASNWISVTRGPLGIVGIARPTVPNPFGEPIRILTGQQYFYLGLPIALGNLILTRLIVSSRLGRTLLAIRENERLAASIGVDTFKYKLVIFTLTGILTGLVGVLYAHYVTVVSPELLWLYWVTTPLTMVIIGGMGSVVGVLAASVVFVFVPEYLRVAQEYRELLYGLTLVIFVLFLPQGIGGRFEEWVYQWQRRQRSSK